MIGASADYCRAGAIEDGAVTGTAAVSCERLVAGAYCGTIIEQFADDDGWGDQRWGSIHGKVRLDLTETSARVALKVQGDLSDGQIGQWKDKRAGHGAGFESESVRVQAKRE